MQFVDFFILLLLFFLWCHDLPADLPSNRLVRFVREPFLWLGLWHSWAMFAPEPLHVNRRLKAIIHYSDGAIDEWRPVEPKRSNWFLDLL